MLFTTQDISNATNPKGYLVNVNPKACTQTLIAVESQAKQANFIKYDTTKDNLYMAFQNPFCIHSSLYQIDPASGSIVRKMGNVVVGEDSNERIGLDVAGQVTLSFLTSILPPSLLLPLHLFLFSNIYFLVFIYNKK
mgnify:CR=1 FL=1